MPAFEMASMDKSEYSLADQSLSNESAVNRIVIKNANLTIVVEDPGLAMQEISSMAERLGGFVVTSNLYKVTKEGGIEVPEVSLTIRVPAETLDQTLNDIKALVSDPDEDVLSENISGQDVTREYTDLESRLRNLENTESQLMEIMDQAKTTEDVMSVFNQLSSVREQIEVIKGQMQYYQESARLSAISINILASEGIQPLTIGKWQPAGIAMDALQALIKALKSLVNALIWIVLFLLPILLLISIPLWLLFRGIRKLLRRKKGKRTTSQESPPPLDTEE
jgi:hypothetical protein